jgi:RNA polymerase sigma-70 factor (ECF subfamily)
VIQAATRITTETSAPAELEPDVLASCRAGDPEALRCFVLRYQRTVFAFLSRTLGHGPHVEDLAQEVFLRAFSALPRFATDGAARPTTWLLTIASRLVIDHRRKRRYQEQVFDEELAASSDSTPETERRRAEIGRALAKAASQLPDKQRDVFVLAEFHELEMREIARVLDVREATVKTRLFRARERLRGLLESLREEI